MIKEHHGVMPKTYEEIIKLPGIGEYTAGAISSICFNQKVLAIDGNVLRVISRILASREDILLPKTKKEIAEKLQPIIPKEAGDFNEALMELGESICLPKGRPQCEKCPLQAYCKSKQENVTEEIPVREKKIKRRIEDRTVFLLQYKDKIALQKREDKGLLAGMYEFPNKEGKNTKQQIKDIVKQWNLEANKTKKIGETSHLFSHIEWRMTAYYIKVKEKNEIFEWVTNQQLEQEFAIPSAFTKWKKIYLEQLT